jgi:hypothetical protein
MTKRTKKPSKYDPFDLKYPKKQSVGNLKISIFRLVFLGGCKIFRRQSAKHDLLGALAANSARLA